MKNLITDNIIIKKISREYLVQTIERFVDESNRDKKQLWMFTLHPGKGRKSPWVSPGLNETLIATDYFISLANNYLLDRYKLKNFKRTGDVDDYYLKCHLVFERSSGYKHHCHILVQQEISDNAYQEKQLTRLAKIVNNKDYMVKVPGGNEYFGDSRGIGFSTEHSSYFHATPFPDPASYLTKWYSAYHFQTHDKTLDFESGWTSYDEMKSLDEETRFKTLMGIHPDF